MKLNTFLIGLLILPFCVNAQHEACGTDITQQDINRIHTALQNQMYFKDRTPADSTVPIKFHIIRNDNGSGGIDSADIFNELATVNAFYINAGIRFFHCGYINYIDNSSFVNFEKITSETLCDTHDQPNLLNVYFAPNVYRLNGSNQVALCGYAYSSSLTKNRVIMDNNCATNGSTLAHEIGHYFSLMHTHHNNNELANGSNCTVAGDELCDTPADPGLSTLTVSASCNYTGSQTDANNQLYNPNVRNIMSYSRKSCRTEFSNGQYARMQSYFQTYRNYLTCAPVATKDIRSQVNLMVYPNPAEGILYFTASQKIKSVTLYDQTGRAIQRQNFNQNKVSIDIQELSSGVYFYELRTAGGLLNGKVWKR